jgi:hypothetical protein
VGTEKKVIDICHFPSQDLQEELLALTTNLNMRIEVGESKDIKDFLEFLIISWRLASDYCNLCAPLMV